MSKVFVLVEDSIYPGMSVNVTPTVFSSLDKAKEEMQARYYAELNDWGQSFEDDDEFEVENGETSCSIYESGRYDENHISWKIEECEVK